MKIANADDVFSLATELDLDVSSEVSIMENALRLAAEKVARKLGVRAEDASFQHGFGGLCVNFRPLTPGQKCPKEIHELDFGGEWE